MSAALAHRLTSAPRPSQRSLARTRVEELLADPRAIGLAMLAAAPPVEALLQGVADHSAYLWRLIRADPARLQLLLEAAPEAAMDNMLADLATTCAGMADVAALMRVLRKAKQHSALLIALADLGGVWDVVEVTQALSQAADMFVAVALRFALADAAAKTKLLLPDPASPETGCGPR